jgi:hypothetical protein
VDHADTSAKASKLVAAVTLAGAAVAAPSGLTAVGVAVGIVSVPAIVTAAPAIITMAGGVMLFSAAASLYAKLRRQRSMDERLVENPYLFGINREAPQIKVCGAFSFLDCT